MILMNILLRRQRVPAQSRRFGVVAAHFGDPRSPWHKSEAGSLNQ
jgi:hypothetical protein